MGTAISFIVTSIIFITDTITATVTDNKGLEVLGTRAWQLERADPGAVPVLSTEFLLGLWIEASCQLPTVSQATGSPQEQSALMLFSPGRPFIGPRHMARAHVLHP